MSKFQDLVDTLLFPAVMEQFGDEAVYSPRTGDSYTITLVFNSGEAVQNSQRVYKTAWAPLTSFSGGEPAKGDSLTIGGSTYTVDEVEKDNQNRRLLKLVIRKFTT